MYKRILAVFIITIGFYSSCNDEILDKSNPSEIPAEEYFANEAQALAAVNAIYAGLQANNMYAREFFFLHDLLGDDMQSGGAQLEAVRAAMLNHNFDGSNKLVNDVWQGLYRVIHRANLVINNVPDIDEVNISNEARTRFIGEAAFLRAWAYFELVSLWGQVPLLTEPIENYAEYEGTSKSSEDAIYTQIFDDLQTAITNLPFKSEYDDANRGRATKGAARAVAARAHMFRGDYEAAEPFLTEIIQSEEYQLVDRYLDNFQEENENNMESLFEVQFHEGSAGLWSPDGSGLQEVTVRGQEYGPTAWRNLLPSDGLASEFETDDPRYDYSFYILGDPVAPVEVDGEVFTELSEEIVQGDASKPSWQKYQMIYKQEAENLQSPINFRVIRYAEVLLNMAEVKNEIGQLDSALFYMNQVRNRADVMMPEYPTAEYPCSNQGETLDAIMHERRVEFGSEQIRNRDIRRWRRQNKLGDGSPRPEPIGVWEDRYDQLPIPIAELDNNPALSNQDQNPGY